MAKATNREKVYKKIELVGCSTKGIEDAINAAIRRAGETVKNLRWFEVKEVRGAIDNNQVQEYQVVLVAGFQVD